MIEDPRMSDDTPERYRWETWVENLKPGDEFHTPTGCFKVQDVDDDGVVDTEGRHHGWADIGPEEPVRFLDLTDGGVMS